MKKNKTKKVFYIADDNTLAFLEEGGKLLPKTILPTDTTINNNPYLKLNKDSIKPIYTEGQIKSIEDKNRNNSITPYGFDTINTVPTVINKNKTSRPVVAPNPVPLYPDVFNKLKKYGWGSTIGSVAGTTLGSIIAPGVGTSLGATLGSQIGGAIDNRIQDNQNIDSQINTQNLFAVGGKIKKYPMGGNSFFPNAEVEGGETMMAPNGETAQFNGPSHEQGGIPVNLTPGTDIFSDRIKVPGTKKTFADFAKKYPTNKFKETAEDRKSTQLQKSTAKIMFEKNVKKQEELFNAQETIKEEKLNKSINRAIMKYGGKVLKNTRPSRGNHIFNYRYVFDQNNHKMMNWSKAMGGTIKYDNGGTVDELYEEYKSKSPNGFESKNSLMARGAYNEDYLNSQLGYESGINPNAQNMGYPKTNMPISMIPYQFSQSSPQLERFRQGKSDLAPITPLGPQGTTKQEDRVPLSPINVPVLDNQTVDNAENITTNNINYKDIGNQILTAAPSIYDLGRGLFGRPEQLNPENYRTGRLSPRDNSVQASIREARIKAAIDNANARGAGLTTGAYLGSAGQASSAAQGTLSQIQQENQRINNAARTSADMFNINMGDRDAQRRLDIENINAMNRAKKSEYLGKGLEGVSGIAQTNKLMQNQAGRDVLRAKSLNSMFRNYKLQPDGTWSNGRGSVLTDEQYKALING